jgi:hypothetical protein
MCDVLTGQRQLDAHVNRSAVLAMAVRHLHHHAASDESGINGLEPRGACSNLLVEYW